MSTQRDFGKLNREQKLQLALAFFQRGEEYYDAAKAAFQTVFPRAPEEMVGAAIHHVYTDGPDAALAFIAAAEMFLRDPREDWLGFQSGITFELLYHIYNWHVFQLLLPEGKEDVLGALDDLKGSVESGEDLKKILKAIEDLRDMLTGHRSYPDVGWSS